MYIDGLRQSREAVVGRHGLEVEFDQVAAWDVNRQLKVAITSRAVHLYITMSIQVTIVQSVIRVQ